MNILSLSVRTMIISLSPRDMLNTTRLGSTLTFRVGRSSIAMLFSHHAIMHILILYCIIQSYYEYFGDFWTYDLVHRPRKPIWETTFSWVWERMPEELAAEKHLDYKAEFYFVSRLWWLLVLLRVHITLQQSLVVKETKREMLWTTTNTRKHFTVVLLPGRLKNKDFFHKFWIWLL